METKSKWVHAQGPEEFETFKFAQFANWKLVKFFDNFNFNYPRVTVALRKVYTAVLKTKSS